MQFMILPNPNDAIHKAWLYRLLSRIYYSSEIAHDLYFKGGTCAAMLGWLDRFSIDLEFDYIGNKSELVATRRALENIFNELGLEIKDKSKSTIQYFTDIDRTIYCQTKETMFSNKLVALIERFELREAIAGRDLYDINHFFMQGFSYQVAVILERRKIKKLSDFFKTRITFIEQHINQPIIDQDLKVLLTPEAFQRMRKYLKSETLMFLRDELKRIESGSRL